VDVFRSLLHTICLSKMELEGVMYGVRIYVYGEKRMKKKTNGSNL
jgi:hypothetical protein